MASKDDIDSRNGFFCRHGIVTVAEWRLPAVELDLVGRQLERISALREFFVMLGGGYCNAVG